MTEERRMQLVIGALLHDIGKIVYRSGTDSQRHALSGAAFLKDRVQLKDQAVLDCVHYHHAAELRSAKIPKDSLAYFVYMADNIASATDRRIQQESDVDSETQGAFDRTAPMASIFNLLNGNDKKRQYSPRLTNMEQAINYPIDERISFEVQDYNKILNDLSEHLRGIEWTKSYVNSLLDVLEADLSFVPSSTNVKEVPDISLYYHMKLTAALALCIDDYLREKEESDPCKALFTNGKDFYTEKAFLLAVLDLSGIQKFIYTIATKGALKTLRSRSFYLDFLMEYIADGLLDRLKLTRANLISVGGGRCSLLLSNTEATRKAFDEYLRDINEWCMEQFDISLYLAGNYVECSSNMFRDEPAGSYAGIYSDITRGLSEHKMHRYTPDDILCLNSRKIEDGTRECKACKSLDRLEEIEGEDFCHICAGMRRLSKHIMENDYEFFAAGSKELGEGLPLPNDKVLLAGSKKDVLKWQEASDESLHIYGKNRFYTGKNVATRLWIGDYHTGETFEELAKMSCGVHRLGILRADVDDLGHAFASGFIQKNGDRSYVTLSRTAELSRQLSLFFKLHIKKLLEHPEFTLSALNKEKRHAAIVYSGGDDLFIVGAWDDIIELAIDIRNAFDRFSEGQLTLSAGIGIYPSGYPISVMADEAALLEEQSKGLPGKNAVTLFENAFTRHGNIEKNSSGETKICDETYHWDILKKKVIGEKLRCIESFFAISNDRGKNFLYNLLELLRSRENKINIARYVYLLSRMEPESKYKEQLESYRLFAENMLKWARNDEDARQLVTAIQIYVLYTRRTEDWNEDNK